MRIVSELKNYYTLTGTVGYIKNLKISIIGKEKEIEEEDRYSISLQEELNKYPDYLGKEIIKCPRLKRYNFLEYTQDYILSLRPINKEFLNDIRFM